MKKLFKILVVSFFGPTFSLLAQLQMNFTASPSVQCSPASRISTVSVQVTQASQCSPFGSGSYSWTVLSPPTTSSAIIPVASGTSAIISCTGC